METRWGARWFTAALHGTLTLPLTLAPDLGVGLSCGGGVGDGRREGLGVGGDVAGVIPVDEVVGDEARGLQDGAESESPVLKSEGTHLDS